MLDLLPKLPLLLQFISKNIFPFSGCYFILLWVECAFFPLIFSACFIMGGILELLSLSECWQLLHNFHVLEASLSKIPP